jgi:aminoglycoside 6-adenylyltransferase
MSRMLVAATRAARLLRRGDLWRAKQACDCQLRGHLLSMLEWHALAMRGPGWDTGYDGRFVARWADPRAVEALPAIFGAYEIADLKRALVATLDLYRRLAVEAAGSWGYLYPVQAHERIAGWVGSVLADV